MVPTSIPCLSDPMRRSLPVLFCLLALSGTFCLPAESADRQARLVSCPHCQRLGTHRDGCAKCRQTAPSEQLAPGEDTTSPQVPDQPDVTDQAPVPNPAADELVPDFGSLSTPRGAATGPGSADLGMIGDFFGGGFILFGSSSSLYVGDFATVPIAGGDRRFKVAEQTRPIPTDRVIFGYNHFTNVARTTDLVEVSIDRYMLGFEKTFLQGMASIELRGSAIQGLNSDQTLSGSSNEESEFGNLHLSTKFLLHENCCWKVGGGLAINLPTASDASFFDSSGGLEAALENNAVFLQPFIGAYYTPTERVFSTVYMATEIDLNGYTVFDSLGDQVGHFNPQHLLYTDLQFGYWLYRCCNGCGGSNGLAAILELHYTTTLNEADRVDTGGSQAFQNPFNHLDVLNLTAGLTFQNGLTNMTIATVAPLRDDEEKLFDSEIQFQLERRF